MRKFLLRHDRINSALYVACVGTTWLVCSAVILLLAILAAIVEGAITVVNTITDYGVPLWLDFTRDTFKGWKNGRAV